MGTVRTLVGRGIYDSEEIAQLLGLSPRAVSRWAGEPGRGGGLLFPNERRLFTFWDLVTARVVSDLLGRKIPLRNIRDARDHLQTKVDTSWPLAHFAGLNRIAVVGRSVYVDPTGDGTWSDATLRGQAPFIEVAAPLMQRLEFEHEGGLASSWRPSDGVVLRPTVQAGAPCVEGTRIATAMLAGLRRQGETVEDLADDYELAPELVRHALRYEESLAQAA